MSFEVDPDSLTAASRVAKRQDRHLRQIHDYVSSTCSNFGAFSGVLNLFEGSYRDAVSTALDGLEDSRAVATKVSDALIDSRDDYLDTDREVYERFKKEFKDAFPGAAFPPYSPPGSGNSKPEGPHDDAPGAETPDAPEGPGGLPTPPGLPWWADKPFGQAAPPPGSPLPPWTEPGDAVKDWAKDHYVRRQDEYQYYRELGYDDKQALELARADRPNASTQADTRNYEQMQQRSRDAYDDAYREARANGASPAEARDAAREAGSRQFGEDSADRGRRQDIRDGVGTVRALYDETGKLIGNVNELGENIDEIRDNDRDIDRYDDYESGEKDESAQEWAGR